MGKLDGKVALVAGRELLHGKAGRLGAGGAAAGWARLSRRLMNRDSTRRAIMGEMGDAPDFISRMVLAMSSGVESLWM